VLRRAFDIADGHGQHAVRVEHFVEALLTEPDARIRLNDLGYADNNEARSQRFQLLSRGMFVGSEALSETLLYSDRLRVWHRAAQKVAEGREPELHTIIIDDFIAAVSGDLMLEDSDLRSLQNVLARYRTEPPVPFRSEANAHSDAVGRGFRAKAATHSD
jgi:hypothetical protein